MDIDYIPEDVEGRNDDVEVSSLLGPNWAYEVTLTFFSPFIWLGLVSLIGPVILGFFNIPLITKIEETIPDWTFVAIGAALITIGVTYSHFLYINTTYILRGKKLFLSSGVFNKKVNTVPLRFVFDCDISASTMEQIFGVNTLTLRATDEGKKNQSLKLHSIKYGVAVRDAILKDSAANEARVISSL